MDILQAFQKKLIATNTGLTKVAVQCSADPDASGWLIKVWFFASFPIAIGIVKIATFDKPEAVGRCKTYCSQLNFQENM